MPIDVIHAQHVLTTVPAVRAGQATGVPVVATVRDYWPVCYWSDLIYDFDADRLCEACTPANMRRCLRGRAGAAGIARLAAHPLHARQPRAQARGTERCRRGHRRQLGHRRRSATRARRSCSAHDVRQIPNPVDVAGIRRAADAAPRPMTEPVRALRRQARAQQGRGPPRRRRARGVAAVAAGRRRRRPPACVARSAARRATGVDLRVQGWLPREQVLALDAPRRGCSCFRRTAPSR